MYQLKITLRDSKPPVWRRILAPEQIVLSTLHLVIQLAFGLDDEHLYMFGKGRRDHPGSDYRSWSEDPEDGDVEDATTSPLWAALRYEGEKLIYTYDFGDRWDYIVLLEKQTNDTNQRSITCLSGKGTTPVENSGGLYGYNELLQQASDPDNPDQSELHSFLMQDIEKRTYDLKRINERLQILN